MTPSIKKALDAIADQAMRITTLSLRCGLEASTLRRMVRAGVLVVVDREKPTEPFRCMLGVPIVAAAEFAHLHGGPLKGRARRAA